MKLGFIGLGIMGRPMCANLLKKGHEVVVFDRHSSAMEEMKGLGASAASCAADVAAQCRTIITMVQNSPQVRQAALGEKGIVEGAVPGTVLIDMSSIDPMESRAISLELAEHGIEMMDAPVSGGQPKAIDGTISIMVGGPRHLFDRYYDVLMCMGGSAVYVGETGAGNIAKLANQTIVAVNIAAVAEALTMAKKAGADPELVYQAIRGGLAGSTVLDAKAPMMMDRNFEPGFRMELHIKDLNNVLSAAHGAGALVPLTSLVMEMMQSLKAGGCAGEDHSALVKFYEKNADAVVERQKGR